MYVLSRNMKNSRILSENFHFSGVKFSVYLNRLVFVMIEARSSACSLFPKSTYYIFIVILIESNKRKQRFVLSFVFLSVTLLSGNYLQSNLSNLSTDGSFTIANSYSFLNPYENLSIAQENKYSGKCLVSS